ncbi:unnamed protein product [Urochloa decumbens]|uniref:KIB1-4 beta-propeller domain-containing protein n=1 Tax=Urochloa decumbens TaxID=240449 RepID=A0ABC9H6I0_9POAL
MAEAGPSRWPDLPADITGLSLRRLPFLLDRLSFGSVCRAWRLLPPPPPPPPPLLRSNDGDTFQSLTPDGPPRRLFTAPPGAAAAATLIRCYDDWLLYYNEREDTYFLFNPLAGASVSDVPLLRNDGVAVKVKHPINKIIACSPDLLVGIFGSGHVAFYRPGTGATSWSVCPSHTCWAWGWFLDIALYRGKIYAVKSTNELFFYELPGRRRQRFRRCRRRTAVRVLGAPGGIEGSEEGAFRLDGPPDRLSRQASDEGIKLLVFEADLEVGRWLELHDLDGQALFVGRGCSKALTLTGDDERLQGNRVYFLGTDLNDCCNWIDASTPSYGFYDLRTGNKISQVFLAGWFSNNHGMDWFFPCAVMSWI